MKFHQTLISGVGILLIALFNTCTTVKDDESNVFRYNENNGISTLDPAFARDLEIMWATNQLFDGLVEMNAQFEIIPSIAHSWIISDDARTYTFYIRDNVFFHDSPVFPNGKGRKVIAQDFVYSFNRIRDPKVASPGAWVFDGVEKNTTAFEAINDSTLVIHLSQAFPPFLSMLTMQYCNVVPKEAIEFYGADFRAHPVGAGPFQFAFWYENNALVFHKFKNYFLTDENGEKLPYLDAIKIDFVKDVSVEYQGMLSGKYDLMSGIHPSYKDELLNAQGELNSAFDDRMVFLKTPFIKTDYIGFMLDEKMTGGKNNPAIVKEFRKAMELAINKKDMVKYLRNNTVIAADNGFIPPVLLDSKTQSTVEYDPQKAISILRELGYDEKNNRATVTISTTPDYTDLIEYMQFNLAQVGIDIQVQVMQGSTFKEAGAKGQLQSFRRSWLADYPDAENFFILFLEKNFCPAGPNYTHWKSEKFESLYQQAMSASDNTKKQALYNELNHLISEQAPVIPLYYDQVSHFLSPSIKNWEINPINLIDLKKVKKVV